MVKEDIHDLKSVLNRNSEKYILQLFEEDQNDVRRFIDDLLANTISAGRVVKYLYSLVVIKRRLNMSFRSTNEDDIRRFIIDLDKTDYSEWTKHDHKIIIKKYLKWLGKENIISWLKVKSVKNGTMPEEVLSEEEIKGIAGVAYTTRDKAFVLSLYESGCRIEEFLPLKLKHMNFDKYGAVLMVQGKTGDRRIRLVACTVALQNWREDHPCKNDQESYLWCKAPLPNDPKVKNNHLSYGFISRLLKELAEKAKVKKAVNPHAFRHARATFMASHLKEPAMREFFGWEKDSDMPATYVHLSGRDIDKSVLSIYGYKDVA